MGYRNILSLLCRTKEVFIFSPNHFFVLPMCCDILIFMGMKEGQSLEIAVLNMFRASAVRQHGKDGEWPRMLPSKFCVAV